MKWYQKHADLNYYVAFFNSGDRKQGNDKYSDAEEKVCRGLGIDTVYIDSPKVNSSSEIIQRAVDYKLDEMEICCAELKEVKNKPETVVINFIRGDYIVPNIKGDWDD